MAMVAIESFCNLKKKKFKKQTISIVSLYIASVDVFRKINTGGYVDTGEVRVVILHKM